MDCATKHYSDNQGASHLNIKEANDQALTDGRKKKILFVLPRLYPGGAERVLITLMNNMDRQNYDVRFVCLSGEGTIRHWIDSDVTVSALYKKRVSSSIVALYKHIKKEKPDTVISTMVHCNAALLLLKPFFKNIRFVVRESSLPMALIKEYGWKGNVCSYIYKYLYPKADLVVSPATIITDEFRHDLKIFTGNHKILFNPVNESRLMNTISGFDVDEKQRLKTQHFICVGRLGYEKGYDRLIESLVSYNAPEGMDWRLDIVGKGAETKNLGELIRKHGLEKNIKLAGYNNAPWPLIAQADCLLLPSRWEGMPNVALEALACGTDVIGHTNAGGITEISKHAKDGEVRVAHDMDEFITLMKDVKPQIKSLPIQSKLPDVFKLKNVMDEFEKLV